MCCNLSLGCKILNWTSHMVPVLLCFGVIHSIINYSMASAALCIWSYSIIWSWQSGNQAIHWVTHRFISSGEFFLRFYKSGWLWFMQNWNDNKGEHSNELAIRLKIRFLNRYFVKMYLYTQSFVCLSKPTGNHMKTLAHLWNMHTISK